MVEHMSDPIEALSLCGPPFQKLNVCIFSRKEEIKEIRVCFLRFQYHCQHLSLFTTCSIVLFH